MNSENVKIEESWKAVLKEEFRQTYFDEIKAGILASKKAGKMVYPPGNLIFNAFNLTPFEKVKVVILGQDPYHGPGEAMGLSFSVPKNVKIPPSLRNIYKELNLDIGMDVPGHGDLSSWAEQGVFLLNAMLTVEHRNPGSHSKIGWQKFTDAVIHKLSTERTGLVFMLWGNFAKNKKSLIDASKHTILDSPHPSPFTGSAFFNNHHFTRANDALIKQGLSPINWQIV